MLVVELIICGAVSVCEDESVVLQLGIVNCCESDGDVSVGIDIEVLLSERCQTFLRCTNCCQVSPTTSISTGVGRSTKTSVDCYQCLIYIAASMNNIVARICCRCIICRLFCTFDCSGNRYRFRRCKTTPSVEGITNCINSSICIQWQVIPTNRNNCRNIIKCSVASTCLLYTSPSPRDVEESRMPSSA